MRAALHAGRSCRLTASGSASCDRNTILQKVAITGGPPVTLARLDGVPRGATWAPDDTIIVATSVAATGLQRVSAAGGTPAVLTRPDHARGEADHLWPEILPDGRGVLFTITAETGGLDAAQIAVLDLRTNAQKILLRGGSHAHYVASGHLVYTAAGTLRAIPFDLNRLETRGTAGPVVPRLVTTSQGAGDFSVTTDGTLLYVDAPAGSTGPARTFVWVDRLGHEEPIAAPPRAYLYPRLSPDGTRIAVVLRRSGAGHLDLGPAESHAHAADVRAGPGPEPCVDAGWPTDHLYVGSRRWRAESVVAGRRRCRLGRAAGHQ